MKEHVIWSNIDFNLDDWYDDIKEFYPEADDDEILNIALETNNEYLDDERINLDKCVDGVIIVIADLGLWNGRENAFAVIKSGRISDILYSDCDYCKWYADDNDIRFTGYHHDGTNHYLYRVFNGDIDELDFDSETDIISKTKSLRPYVAEIYGWKQ